MPVSATIPTIIPAASLQRLESLEDRIQYKYSQDRIDQGLDQDGNEIEDPSTEHFRVGENEQDYSINMQWLLKLLAKLEEVAPDESEEDEENTDDQQEDDKLKSRSLVRKLETPLEIEYRNQHGILTERVSSCLTHFCGRAASGAMTRTWKYNTTPPQSLQIHDPSFIGGDVGFKTFGSAYLLSKHIAHGDIPQLCPWTLTPSSTLSTTSLPLPKILELGSGTGLVGFAATLFSDPRGPKVILSDYHPNVLSTLQQNSKLNHLEEKCNIQLLDWRDVLQRRKHRRDILQPGASNSDTIEIDNNGERNGLPQQSTEYDNILPASSTAFESSSMMSSDPNQEMLEMQRMDLILGAEVVYDHGHAELVAHVVDEFLKRELISNNQEIPLSRRRPAFHIMFPIRKTHSDVIADFDFWMDKMGFVDCREAKEWGREDGETIFLYHWREYVRREHLSE
ncbi:hypothetical protein BGZ76_000597 [Entomortierella beljakovae]|nr:hypothetical protein BGZ76_000597 [Entomortierella beljakovae]